jgi:hypothetical protein
MSRFHHSYETDADAETRETAAEMAQTLTRAWPMAGRDLDCSRRHDPKRRFQGVTRSNRKCDCRVRCPIPKDHGLCINLPVGGTG